MGNGDIGLVVVSIDLAPFGALASFASGLFAGGLFASGLFAGGLFAGDFVLGASVFSSSGFGLLGLFQPCCCDIVIKGLAEAAMLVKNEHTLFNSAAIIQDLQLSIRLVPYLVSCLFRLVPISSLPELFLMSLAGGKSCILCPFAVRHLHYQSPCHGQIRGHP